MVSFWRALKFANPYKLRLLVAILSGAVVAVFWGANISGIYPLLTVLLEKKTLVSWIDERIAREQSRIAELEASLPEIGRPAELARRAHELDSRNRWLAHYEAVRPYLARYTPNDSFRTLCWLMLALLIGILIKGVFDFLQVYLSDAVVQLAVFDLRKRLYRRTIGLDLGYFSDKGTHQLMARFTNDVEALSSGLRALLGRVLLEPLKSISCLVFACILNWRLTFVALLLSPAAILAMAVMGRYLKRVSRRNLESMSRIYKILQESFAGIRVVKAFTMERYERRRFFAETKKYYKQAMKLSRTDAIGGPLLECFAVVTIIATLLAGSYLVLTGETHVWGVRLTFDPLEHGMLLTLYALIIGMCDPMRKVFAVYGRIQRAVAASERIMQALDQRPLVAQAPRAIHLPRHCRGIELRDLSFGYDGLRPVLYDINLSVTFGETIAVVGTTGCGKTSLINLLPRFYDPQQGSVQIDGIDIRKASLASLRQQIGIVTQNTVLFDDSIFNNIAYGHSRIEPEKVEAAAQAAYADQFIEELPHGYATTIGEMGNTLSGGQRQRIALARAILRDPAILILDEATSSLDVESEALIHKTLRTFARGRTTFIVTHRLSTLEIADRIVVINAGRIEAVGTHEQVIGKSPTYSRLYEVYARGA